MPVELDLCGLAGRDAIPGFETESIRVDHNLRNSEPAR
jgi:hypothetical protein